MNAPAPVSTTRASKRTRVLMTATLYSPRGAQTIRIRDLSAGGAQVVLEVPISSDCDAILKRGSLFLAVRVAWVIGSESGIQFYRELSDQELASTFHAIVRC